MPDLPPIHPTPVDGAFLRAMVGVGARTVLEVGANRGMHTPMLLHAFPGAQVHAFEPDPRACEHFRTAIRDRRVTLHQLALGAVNGRTEFHVSSGQPPAGFPASREEYPKGRDQSGSIRKPKKQVELYEGQATLGDLLGMLPGFEIVRRYDDDVLLRNTAIDRAIVRP
ncbi:MAG: FkbM family methyltransferase [Phycisphaerales bacterium]|nr:FkbM family methyltransferase [Phycisphaerales bacterium]